MLLYCKKSLLLLYISPFTFPIIMRSFVVLYIIHKWMVTIPHKVEPEV